MDVFESENVELTGEQLARVKALECATRIVASRSYHSNTTYVAESKILARSFYRYIMNG